MLTGRGPRSQSARPARGGCRRVGRAARRLCRPLAAVAPPRIGRAALRHHDGRRGGGRSALLARLLQMGCRLRGRPRRHPRRRRRQRRRRRRRHRRRQRKRARWPRPPRWRCLAQCHPGARIARRGVGGGGGGQALWGRCGTRRLEARHVGCGPYRQPRRHRTRLHVAPDGCGGRGAGDCASRRRPRGRHAPAARLHHPHGPHGPHGPRLGERRRRPPGGGEEGRPSGRHARHLRAPQAGQRAGLTPANDPPGDGALCGGLAPRSLGHPARRILRSRLRPRLRRRRRHRVRRLRRLSLLLRLRRRLDLRRRLSGHRPASVRGANGSGALAGRRGPLAAPPSAGVPPGMRGAAECPRRRLCGGGHGRRRAHPRARPVHQRRATAYAGHAQRHPGPLGTAGAQAAAWAPPRQRDRAPVARGGRLARARGCRPPHGPLHRRSPRTRRCGQAAPGRGRRGPSPQLPAAAAALAALAAIAAIAAIAALAALAALAAHRLLLPAASGSYAVVPGHRLAFRRLRLHRRVLGPSRRGRGARQLRGRRRRRPALRRFAQRLRHHAATANGASHGRSAADARHERRDLVSNGLLSRRRLSSRGVLSSRGAPVVDLPRRADALTRGALAGSHRGRHPGQGGRPGPCGWRRLPLRLQRE